MFSKDYPEVCGKWKTVARNKGRGEEALLFYLFIFYSFRSYIQQGPPLVLVSALEI